MKNHTQRTFNLSLYAGQWALAATFELSGLIKLGLPADQLQRAFGGEGAALVVQRAGALELALAVAAILPAATRVLPQLSTFAAAALAAVALLGATLPASGAGVGFASANLALVALAGFVVWGRLAKAPIRSLPVEVEDLAAEELVRAQVARARARLQRGSAAVLDPRPARRDEKSEPMPSAAPRLAVPALISLPTRRLRPEPA